MAIYSEAYKHQIEILFKNYGLNYCNIEFVENIPEWCKQHEVQENDNFKIIKSLLTDEKKQPLILIKKLITEDDIKRVKSFLSFEGFEEKVDMLNDNWLFVKYILLHEMCPVIKKDCTEVECDKWTFSQLDKEGM